MVAEPPHDGQRSPSVVAIRIEDAARMLGISVDMLRADITAGAPVNTDGTLNLVHYAAWLNKAAKEDSDGD